VGGQRRRHKKPFRFKVEEWIHRSGSPFGTRTPFRTGRGCTSTPGILATPTLRYPLTGRGRA
jgi:hypothetical protein